MLLAVRSSLFSSIQQIDIPTDLEFVCCEVTTNNDKFLLASCYRPPNSNISWCRKFGETLQYLRDVYDQIVIAGDFNLPSIDWNCLENTTGSDELEFTEILNDYFLKQLSVEPTRLNNVLDLIITSSPDRVEVLDIISPNDAGIFTDHAILQFEIKIQPEKAKTSRSFVFDYHNTDFNALRNAIQTENLSAVIDPTFDINKNWSNWITAFNSLISRYVKTKTLKRKRNPPWLTGEILHELHVKNTMTMRNKFKQLRSRVKHMIANARKNYFISVATELNSNPKRFWSLFKYASKKSSLPQRMTLRSSDNDDTIAADDPNSIADLFNTFFASVFHQDQTHPANETTITDENCLTDIELTVDDILPLLHSLNEHKATGPDGISNKILKETAEQVAPSLCLLFNLSLRSGSLPDDWKISNIVPVFKKGKRDHVSNYRPISLLSNISKVLERCVLVKTRDHLLQYVSDNQHGFIPGRSCTTQLVQVLECIGQQLDNGKQTDIIYLDMSKAFDRVRHDVLLDKLQNINIRGNLHSWFSSYLSGRKQRVTVPGGTSTSLAVTSGVPQGSILGPVLFLLYVNDIHDTVIASSVSCFADDTKLFKTINNQTDANLLQNDLDNLSTWSTSSGLNFNELKTNCQTVTRKRSPSL